MTETPFDEPCAHGFYDEEACPVCDYTPRERAAIITGLAVLGWAFVGALVWSFA